MYLLALERAPAGSFFFAEGGEAAMVDTNRAVGRMLGLGDRSESWPFDEALKTWGPPMAYAMSANVRVTSQKARDMLGWQPAGTGLFDEIEKGSYQMYR
jgi:nucleoside-diphosphate-sugar epimerase